MRHIALLVEDPEKSAQFFESAFGMQRAGKAGRGLYMSDGTINIALLKVDHSNPKEKVGIYHFGMWVDDLDKAEKAVTAAGGTYLAGRPDGIVFDLTHNGWRGAVKEVVPEQEFAPTAK
jgi:methylmalonyl-CoA/ethylmalonyl-CoA epimerase